MEHGSSKSIARFEVRGDQAVCVRAADALDDALADLGIVGSVGHEADCVAAAAAAKPCTHDVT